MSISIYGISLLLALLAIIGLLFCIASVAVIVILAVWFVKACNKYCHNNKKSNKSLED